MLQIHPLRHELAFASEHDDVGIDPLRVRAHMHDGMCRALELTDPQLPLAIIAPRCEQKAFAVGEEPRPVHTNVADRAVRGEDRPREIARPSLCPMRMIFSAPHVPCLASGRPQSVTAGPAGRSKRFNLASAKKASERPLGDQNTEVAPSVPGNGRASRSVRARSQIRLEPVP